MASVSRQEIRIAADHLLPARSRDCQRSLTAKDRQGRTKFFRLSAIIAFIRDSHNIYYGTEMDVKSPVYRHLPLCLPVRRRNPSAIGWTLMDLLQLVCRGCNTAATQTQRAGP